MSHNKAYVDDSLDFINDDVMEHSGTALGAAYVRNLARQIVHNPTGTTNIISINMARQVIQQKSDKLAKNAFQEWLYTG